MPDQSMSNQVWVKPVSSEQLGKVVGLEGRWLRWLSPNQENQGMIFGMGELQPGEVAGWHEHPEPELRRG